MLKVRKCRRKGRNGTKVKMLIIRKWREEGGKPVQYTNEKGNR